MSARCGLLAVLVLLPTAWISAAEPAEQTLPKSLAPFFRPPPEFARELGPHRSLLKFTDGSAVRNAEDWQRRRHEILKNWHGIMGLWPALIEKPRTEYLEKEQ